MFGIIAKIGLWFGGAAIQKITKCIPVIVAEVEKAMIDGKITAAERKQIAMTTIDALAKGFGIPVNGIVRFGISWLVDQIAKKLPSKDMILPLANAVAKSIQG